MVVVATYKSRFAVALVRSAVLLVLVVVLVLLQGLGAGRSGRPDDRLPCLQPSSLVRDVPMLQPPLPCCNLTRLQPVARSYLFGSSTVEQMHIKSSINTRRRGRAEF